MKHSKAPQGLLSGKSVLILEEAALIAVDIEAMLGELGALRITTAATDSHKLMTSLSADKPDLAVVDVHSAAGLKFNAAEIMKSIGVPVVFLSTDAADLSATTIPNILTFVLKPFTADDIRQAIADLFALP